MYPCKLLAVLACVLYSLMLEGQGDSLVYVERKVLCETEPYKLVFYDEFEGNSLDTNLWYSYYPYGKNGSDACSFCRTHSTAERPEGQVYMDKNVRVHEGVLYLDIIEEPGSWYEWRTKYTSGMIHSKQKFRSYSKYEIRCKIPSGLGFWPAFWAFGWTTEIDVFEFGTQNPDEFLVSVHEWDNAHIYWNQWVVAGIDLSKDFHVYAVEYDRYFVRFLLDGKEVALMPLYYSPDGTPVTSCVLDPGVYKINPEFPRYGYPLQVIANVAVGYNDENGKRLTPFTAAPNSKTILPQSMAIDYIRVYQRRPQEDLADLAGKALITVRGSKGKTVNRQLSIDIQQGISNLLQDYYRDHPTFSSLYPAYRFAMGLETKRKFHGYGLSLSFRSIGAVHQEEHRMRINYLGLNPYYFVRNKIARLRMGTYYAVALKTKYRFAQGNAFDIRRSTFGLSLAPDIRLFRFKNKSLRLGARLMYDIVPLSANDSDRNLAVFFGISIN